MTFKMRKPPEKPARLPRVIIQLEGYRPEGSDSVYYGNVPYVTVTGEVIYHSPYGARYLDLSNPIEAWFTKKKAEYSTKLNLSEKYLRLMEVDERDYGDDETTRLIYLIYEGSEPDYLFEPKLRKYEETQKKYDKWIAENTTNIAKWQEKEKLRKEEERQKKLLKLKRQVTALEKK